MARKTREEKAKEVKWNRAKLSFHDEYGALCRRYGIYVMTDVTGVPTMSSEWDDEPNREGVAKHLKELQGNPIG